MRTAPRKKVSLCGRLHCRSSEPRSKAGLLEMVIAGQGEHFSGGTGLQAVLDAAQAALQGASMEVLLSLLESVRQRARVIAMLDEYLPAFWSRRNPVDLVAPGRVSMITDSIEALLKHADMDAILGRIKPTLDMKEAAADADVVVEVIIELLDIKKKVFQELETIVKPECLFFSNTSGVSITAMAAVTKRPGKFIGTHFFNPVPLMALVAYGILRLPDGMLASLQSMPPEHARLGAALLLALAPSICSPGFRMRSPSGRPVSRASLR